MKAKLTILLFLLTGFFHESHARTESLNTCADSIKVPASFCLSCESFDKEFSLEIDCFLTKFKFSLFNKAKEKVYSSTYSKFKWDGKDENGFKVETGTYVWHMDYTYQTRTYQKKGFLTIF